MEQLGSEAINDALKDLFVQAASNRMRELQSPSDADLKRWVWELLQNAKDTISTDNGRQNVDAVINANENIVEFRHNGAPFNPKTILG